MIAVARQSRLLSRPCRRFVLNYVGECLYRSEAGSYFGVVKHQGKQHRHCLGTKDRDIARRKLAEYRQQLRGMAPQSRSGNGKHSVMSFEHVANRWLKSIEAYMRPRTHERRTSTVHRLIRDFGRHPIKDIRRWDCERWATKRYKENVKPRTWNYDVETLKLIFRYAVENGWLLDNPAAHLKRTKEPKPPILIPSRKEFIELVRDMRSRTSAAADWIEFLAYSGCRSGEASAVLWRDVDFVKKTLLISGGEHGTKNGECRTIPLFPPLERLLTTMRASLPKPPKPNAKVLARINCRWALQTVCKRLALPPYHRHSFRHFFASNAIEAGCDFKVIAEWLGHKDGGRLVAEIYGHLRQEHSELMARRMTFDAGAGGAFDLNH